MRILLDNSREVLEFMRKAMIETIAIPEYKGKRKWNELDSGLKVDSVASRRGAKHLKDGSLVRLWYNAADPATDRQKREAQVVSGMGGNLHEFSGRFIDILVSKEGKVRFLVLVKERIDENNGEAAFRAFCPERGEVMAMEINYEPPFVQKASPPQRGTEAKVSLKRTQRKSLRTKKTPKGKVRLK